ncbi:MAG: B12-binding domain-containing radical SAM protein [Hungatella sp.]
MKFLLVAINAKYIHSNLGVYSLQAYAAQRLAEQASSWTIEIGEYTINHQMELILKDIYRRKPDAIGCSCYIWNIGYMRDLIRDLHKLRPKMQIWLGGPEVSYDAAQVLRDEPGVTGIMVGEGEETFAQLMESYGHGAADCETLPAPAWYGVNGLVFRGSDGAIVTNPIRPVMDMSRIPFAYRNLDGFEHKIIYYESSRGCPYSCSYCLSSIDKAVRFRDLSLVKTELDFFLEHRVSQVKFVDRTFNCKKSHALAIWSYILEHDNGITNFHFEISADILEEEELAIMRQMRPGLIQLEIGVQTSNPQTIREIRRTMDLDKLRSIVSWINQGHNIHQHLDLIAGLPYEGYESFVRSFHEVYAMRPEQLQLGFLKVLKGSYMAEMAEAYELIYQSRPPYEVLSTKWICYEELLRLKAVEEMVEVYYNSGQFRRTIESLEGEFSSAFAMFTALADYYEEEKLFDISHNRLARYEILYQFMQQQQMQNLSGYRDLLMQDLYLRENSKSRPSFAMDQGPYKTEVRDFFMAEAKNPLHLLGYEAYDSRQISKMAHVEVLEDGHMILFDYLNRDPLNYNAKATRIQRLSCT